MNTKSRYKTRHSEDIKEYLKSVKGVHITVNDVCDYFKNAGMPIGMTTVYRQLERMVDEGIVQKYIIDTNSPACFEYIGEEVHEDKETCFHCKCEKCGKLIHLHCEELEEVQKYLKSRLGFAVDPMRTVFYGFCTDCADGIGQEV